VLLFHLYLAQYSDLGLKKKKERQKGN